MTMLGPFGFNKGLNKKASALTIGENQMSDAQNIRIEYGDLVKRSGSRKLNSSAISGTPAVHGLYDWQVASGQRSFIVTAGTKIFKANDLTTTLTDITGAVTITAGQDNQSTFSSLNNIMVRCGGTTPDAPIKWTGAGNAAALAGSPPSGNIVTQSNNYMFISGVAAAPSRVYNSNVIDPETWGGTSYFDFRKDDGDVVTALIPKQQNLLVFKRRSFGLIYTEPPDYISTAALGPVITLNSGIGCVGSQALDNLPDGSVVFLSANGHLYHFGDSLTDLSDPEPNLSNIQPSLDSLNASRLKYAVVRYYPTRKQILISASTTVSTTNNIIYAYNTVLGCWESPFTDIAANVMGTSLDTRTTTSHPIVWLTGNYAGQVYEQDYGDSNPEATANAIDGYATTSINLSGGAVDFSPRALVLSYEEGDTDYNIEVNYGFGYFTNVTYSGIVSVAGTGTELDAFLLDTDTLGNPTTIRKVLPIPGAGRANSIQVQFRNRNANQPFTIHPFYISDEIVV